jgi:LDH2 family malate/lactate/ureidoglycolate dehydrogenase
MTKTEPSSGERSKSATQRFNPQRLIEYATGVLAALGVPEPDARQVAECLTLADLRGVDSHGLLRLPVYARRVKAKVVKARPQIEVSQKFSAVACVDGDNGLGPVVGSRAMETAIELAKTAGFAFAGVRGSNHFGVGAYYVQKATRENLIGFATSNAPPNMAPFGGRERFLGTNPFAIGIPMKMGDPLVFDASSSVAARGKIIAAAKQGLPIPPGWAIDLDGNPTVDARAALAGAVLPFGGAKGSAISFIIDILCGVLTGASFAFHLNTLEDLQSVQNVGHVFAAVRTDCFLPAAEFLERMDEISKMLMTSPPVPGVPRVLLPGEPECQAEEKNRKLGISLPREVIQELADLGNEANVPFPNAAEAL